MSDTPAGLTPANQNPWYVLMTLYGEQVGEQVDEELHARNRRAWNAWACQALGEEERATWDRADEPEWKGWKLEAGQVMADHEAAMMSRNGAGFVYPGFPDAKQDVDMRALAFACHVEARGLLFPGAAAFQKATFGAQAGFDGATFSGPAGFGGATFSGPAGFGGATFRKRAGFDGTTFSGEAGFGGATFSWLAWFGGATFSERAWFVGATFSERAGFDDATFSGQAGFGNARFSGEAWFGGATFSGEAWFGGATFSGFVYFSEAKFGVAGGDQAASFRVCQFGKPTSFRDAVFHARYPDFAGAVLHDKTAFTDHPDHWPKGPQSDPAAAKASCAVIRHNVGKQGLPEAEHFFFRREMGFAGRSGPWLQRPTYWLFGWFSDFGASILTPLLWLCLLIFGGGLVLAWGLMGTGSSVTFEAAVGLSFANVFNFLSFHKTFATEAAMAALPAGLKVFSALQTIFGVILLFFLGLGLRTRFRLR